MCCCEEQPGSDNYDAGELSLALAGSEGLKRMGWLACNCRWRQLPVASARVLPSAKPATIMMAGPGRHWAGRNRRRRSEEHTSELQSLMRISYAVFCLKKKRTYNEHKS